MTPILMKRKLAEASSMNIADQRERLMKHVFAGVCLDSMNLVKEGK